MPQNQACDSAQVVYKTNQLSVQRGIFLPIEILEQEIPYLFEYKSHFFLPENQSKIGGATYTRGYVK